MTDPFDRAQQLEEQFREDALNEHRRRMPTFAGDAPTHCQAPRCGEPIPEARRRALPGVRLCLDCQLVAERGTR